VLIDWFTVAAQVVNLLVLVLLLRRFLYGPITRAMAMRQDAITAQAVEAEQLADDARAEGDRLRALTRELSQEREQRLAALTEEIEELRREQLRAARVEVDQLQQRWEDAVVRERDAFLAELRHRVGQQILEVVRRAVLDLSGEELDTVVIGRFVAELHRLDEAQRRLVAAVADEDGVIRIRTATSLASEARDALTAAVRTAIDPQVEVRFEESPTLLSGVELHVTGFKLAWTIEDYLDSLESELAETLGEEPMADARP
jgi:F-type H+-transporting ATPase subunit b